jgi:hypothetical protein
MGCFYVRLRAPGPLRVLVARDARGHFPHCALVVGVVALTDVFVFF